MQLRASAANLQPGISNSRIIYFYQSTLFGYWKDSIINRELKAWFTVSRLSQILPTNETRNRSYLRSSRMDGDKSGGSGEFLFSRRVPDFCDGRRSFLFFRGHRWWISLITNPLNFWAPVPLSQINMASLENLGQIIRKIGKIWDG